MDLLSITRIISLSGMAVGLLGLLLRWRGIMNRPHKKDLSRPRGSEGRGILYAFTLGMAPWEKESTRMHWIAYIRGILFHVGVFASFGVVLFASYLENFPGWVRWGWFGLTASGAVFGFAGIWMRWHGQNERALSLPDDYFSVFLTSLFALLASITLLTPVGLPFLYVVTAILSIYVPFSKIRHCAYFFYSKFIFGKNFGHRGVLGPNNQKMIR